MPTTPTTPRTRGNMLLPWERDGDDQANVEASSSQIINSPTTTRSSNCNTPLIRRISSVTKFDDEVFETSLNESSPVKMPRGRGRKSVTDIAVEKCDDI